MTAFNRSSSKRTKASSRIRGASGVSSRATDGRGARYSWSAVTALGPRAERGGSYSRTPAWTDKSDSSRSRSYRPNVSRAISSWAPWEILGANRR